MPDEHANLLTGPKYVLTGRIVTMGPQDVVPHGAIYVDAGEIKAVQKATLPPPEGFAGAPRINTGDSIYPGMIELHNHLSYNAMSLWDVPQQYGNNGQWKNHPDYKRLITKPSQVLGRSAGVVEALVRYVECRCLLGGVTTTQGITLASAGQIKKFYKGLVRNVEQTGDPRFPEAGTRIANPNPGEAATYLQGLQALQGKKCYLQHLSEGRDKTARQWFLNLKLDDDTWAITEALCGIHSSALQAEDLQILANGKGSVVWSPLSNYLLYGKTADIKAIKDSGVLVGIGSDWAPSGSKNILGELKVAWLDSQERGGVFTAKEIAAMATINAARILKWQAVVGSIEPGKRADFVVIDGQDGDDYMRLIEALETQITLVVIDGIPRMGKQSLMQPFGPGTEEIKIGNAKRLLMLSQPDAHPLVGGLTLTAARQRLAEAMHNLPELAQRLDGAIAQGAFAGSVDAEGTPWRVVLDFEDAESEIALAAEGLATYVQPMQLAGITVADDPQFLPALAAARNLPEFIKNGLPPLYHQPIPPSGSANFLLRQPEDSTAPQLIATTRDLKTFLRTWGELSLEDRKVVVNQAIVLLEQNYVHLPLKRAMYAVDPVQRLRLLRYRLDQAQEGELPPEIEFHQELTRIFSSLRDLHTTYRLPRPFLGKIAWLPFLIEEYWEDGRCRYLVSRIIGKPGPDSFKPGVEALYWNGMPIDRAVAQIADQQAGGNAAARHARGLNSLTIRPLAATLPPEEEWVTLRYKSPQDGKIHEYTQPWLVFEPGARIGGVGPASLLKEAAALGVDAQTDDIQEMRKTLFAWSVATAERRAIEQGEYRAVSNFSKDDDGVDTYLPTAFRAVRKHTPHGVFGYVRIFTFNVADAAEFVWEFVRLAEQLPSEGLIIDVRGNGGGLIYAAERLLQVLTPRHIEPERAQFINSPLNLRICRNNAPSPLLAGLDLSRWIDSIAQSVETGATFSSGHPITDEDSCNEIGQRFYGPVLLITDALCYSATDMFAAGFRDHDIGPIIGVSGNTGAGGANVWSYGLMSQLLPPAGGPGTGVESPYAALPGGADFRVAMRRTMRVGPNAGSIVEDLGTRPDYVHNMTRRDLLEGNQDLIEAAAELLAKRTTHSIQVTVEPGSDARPLLRIATRNLNRLDVLANDRPLGSFDLAEDGTPVDPQNLLGNLALPVRLELQGFMDGKLAARRRELVGQA